MYWVSAKVDDAIWCSETKHHLSLTRAIPSLNDDCGRAAVPSVIYEGNTPRESVTMVTELALSFLIIFADNHNLPVDPIYRAIDDPNFDLSGHYLTGNVPEDIDFRQ